MREGTPGYELTVDGREFAGAMRTLGRTSKRSAASEMTLTYAGGELVAEISGAAVGVSAEGAWLGTVTISRKAIEVLARLDAGKTILTVTPDERLKVGSTFLSCPSRHFGVDRLTCRSIPRSFNCSVCVTPTRMRISSPPGYSKRWKVRKTSSVK